MEGKSINSLRRLNKDYTFHALRYFALKYFPDRESSILDLGSGPGRNLDIFLTLGYQNLYGLDLDSWAITQGQKKGITMFKSNLMKDKIPLTNEAVHVTTALHVIEHLYSPFHMLKEIYRVLKKKGCFILVTPDFSKQYKIFYQDSTHVKPYLLRSLCDVVQTTGFKIQHASSFNVKRGLGRTPLWRIFPRFLFSGDAICVVGKKI